MDAISFVEGAVIALFVFALFNQDKEEGIFPEPALEEPAPDIKINGATARTVILSCQTCRKLKKHREIEEDLWQCTKCKRHVDLRST